MARQLPWLWRMRHALPTLTFGNYVRPGSTETLATLAGRMGSILDPGMCWDDVRALRERWPGPLLLKGILHPEAAQAARLGIDGLIVSNHGEAPARQRHQQFRSAAGHRARGAHYASDLPSCSTAASGALDLAKRWHRGDRQLIARRSSGDWRWPARPASRTCWKSTGESTGQWASSARRHARDCACCPGGA
jgi:hypothetical protein